MTQLKHLAILAKWLSAYLQTKWLWSPIAVTYTSDITPVSRITFSLAKSLSVCL